MLNLNGNEWLKATGMFLVSLPLEILSFIVTPIVLLFCKKEDEHLPKFFKWFDEPNWGINGDYGWRKDHFQEPENRTYWARCRWLWRNRINGFQIQEQGCDVSKLKIETLKVEGDTLATNNKGNKDSSCIVRVKDNSGNEYFSLYYEKKWCSIFYLRMYIGWKLMDINNAKTQMDLTNWVDSRRLEHKLGVLESVFSIHPFRKVK